MAVVAVWKCDRDDSMFKNKKEAEEHDKMLELAENIAALIDANIEGFSESHCEDIGILLSKHREILAKACKGKPDILLDWQEEAEKPSSENSSNKEPGGSVTSITATSIAAK